MPWWVVFLWSNLFILLSSYHPWLARIRVWLSHKVTWGVVALSLAGSYVLSALSSDPSSESDSLPDHRALSEPLFPERLPDPQNTPPLVGLPLANSSDSKDLAESASESSVVVSEGVEEFLLAQREADKRIINLMKDLYADYLDLSSHEYQSRIFELYPLGSSLQPVDRRRVFYDLGQHFSQFRSRTSVSRGLREQFLFLAVFMKLDHLFLEDIAKKMGVSHQASEICLHQYSRLSG